MLQGNLNRIDSQKLLSGFTHFYRSNIILGMLAVGYHFVINTLSIPARLLLRKNLGERAFAVPSFILSIGFFSYVNFILFAFFCMLFPFGLYARIYNGFEDYSSVFQSGFFPGLLLFLLSPFVIFLFFLSIKAIRHFKCHFIRAKNNFIAYSAYRGEGRYFKHRIGGKIFGLEVDEFLLRMLVEPIALFKVGFAFVTLSIIFVFIRKSHPVPGFLFELIDSVNFGILAIGVTLVISSFSLFLEEYSIMQNERNTILDMFDAEQDMQQILAKKDKLKTEHPKVSEKKILENSDVQLS